MAAWRKLSGMTEGWATAEEAELAAELLDDDQDHDPSLLDEEECERL